MAKTPKNDVVDTEFEPVQEQATAPVAEYKPVADFVPRVTPPSAPEPRISNLTRASHASWRRTFKMLRGSGRLAR